MTRTGKRLLVVVVLGVLIAGGATASYVADLRAELEASRGAKRRHCRNVGSQIESIGHGVVLAADAESAARARRELDFPTRHWIFNDLRSCVPEAGESCQAAFYDAMKLGDAEEFAGAMRAIAEAVANGRACAP